MHRGGFFRPGRRRSVHARRYSKVRYGGTRKEAAVICALRRVFGYHVKCSCPRAGTDLLGFVRGHGSAS